MADIYRKSTFTGLGMKFNTKISTIYKNNPVNCLLGRGFKICPSKSNFQSSLDKLLKYFDQSSFPVHFTEKIVNQKLSSLRNISLVTFDFPRKTMFISLPYISDLSNENIRLKLTTILACFYPQIYLRFAVKNILSIQFASTYIAKTSRHLLARIADHNGISIRAGQPFATSSNSYSHNHALEAGRDISIDNF